MAGLGVAEVVEEKAKGVEMGMGEVETVREEMGMGEEVERGAETEKEGVGLVGLGVGRETVMVERVKEGLGLVTAVEEKVLVVEERVKQVVGSAAVNLPH